MWEYSYFLLPPKVVYENWFQKKLNYFLVEAQVRVVHEPRQWETWKTLNFHLGLIIVSYLLGFHTKSPSVVVATHISNNFHCLVMWIITLLSFNLTMGQVQ